MDIKAAANVGAGIIVSLAMGALFTILFNVFLKDYIAFDFAFGHGLLIFEALSLLKVVLK
jgi:hypothetical protein